VSANPNRYTFAHRSGTGVPIQVSSWYSSDAPTRLAAIVLHPEEYVMVGCDVGGGCVADADGSWALVEARRKR
jgi:hypothetical protein